MILVDTSVWIDYFKGVDNPQTNLFDTALVDGIAAIGDLIFLEILQGIRNEADYKRTRQSLLTLEQYQLFSPAMAEKCAHNYRELRKQGITIRKTADVIIGTFCVESALPLLFLDRDFMPFVEHFGLEPAVPAN